MEKEHTACRMDIISAQQTSGFRVFWKIHLSGKTNTHSILGYLFSSRLGGNFKLNRKTVLYFTKVEYIAKKKSSLRSIRPSTEDHIT